MISQLTIENFALIERLSIDFSAGFSIITGETGAGKSILLGALGLVLGKRADLSSLKDKQEKCIVEAHFDLRGYDLQDFFDAIGFDYDDETIIRREILPSGKSRAFVNDSPVNLQELQQLGEFLLDIHSQHQTLSLSEEDFQFSIIDAMAGNRPTLSAYRDELRNYRKQHAELAEKQAELQRSLKEQDYQQFLLEELNAARLVAGEQVELERSFEQLSNVELIREHLDKSIAVATDDSFGVQHGLGEMRAALHKLSAFQGPFQELSERLNSVAIELADLVAELERSAHNLQQDPSQLESLNQKLQIIYNLQKKHGVSTVEELLDLRSQLEQKTADAQELEKTIDDLEAGIRKSAEALDILAKQLHENRGKVLPDLDARLLELLAQLGMPDARFHIAVSTTDDYLHNGKDRLEFLLAANKGSQFGQLKKVASGGELSRIMLAVKSILAKYSKLPTIVFDEIDTGVSGEIAFKMAQIMAEMSRNMQVLAITHLPQIAAKGEVHYKVSKTVSNHSTFSEINRLTPEQRVVEIAQMLSGSEVSDSAINHAKALLK